MEIFVVFVALFVVVFVLITNSKNKTNIEEIQKTVRLNKELTDIDLTKIAKDNNERFDKLDKTVNGNNKSSRKALENLSVRLDDAAKAVKEDRAIIAEMKRQFVDNDKRIVELEKQLGIVEDSKKLSSSVSFDNDLQYELDSEQKQAFDLMEKSFSNVFITGKAGTGKSYLLKYFVENTNKKVIVLAPTGISAINVNGVTIHSAFGFDNLQPEFSLTAMNLNNLSLSSEKKLVLQCVETIIIDEISMVSSDLFEKIDKILKLVNGNNMPFGGKQILIFGDVFQLPPVAKKSVEDFLNDIYGGIYFFNSSAYNNSNFAFVELNKNHRQKDDTVFFDILNNIRDGNFSEQDLNILNERSQLNQKEIDRTTIKLFPKKVDVAKLNKQELDKLPEKEYTFKCNIVYSEKPNVSADYIETNLPISETLKIKVGAVVMMVSNDPNRNWVNGTLGIVKSIGENFVNIQIARKVNDKEISKSYDVFKESFIEEEKIYKNGELTSKRILEVVQYPFVLAYAITIHKSQGKTFEKIACNVSSSFATGQAYVALSRCQSLEGLHLYKPVKISDFRTDSKVLNFYKSLKSNKT